MNALRYLKPFCPLLLWPVFAGALQADRQKAHPSAQDLDLFVGETTVIPRPRATRVLVGHGNIVTAAVLENHDVLLVANTPGSTSLNILTIDGATERWTVRVHQFDMTHVSAEITAFLAGMRNVTTRIVGDKVIVDGEALNEQDLFKLDELAKRYPQIVNLAAFQKDRPWEKMILMDVKVVEIARTRSRDLGIRWQTTAPGPQAGLAGDLASNSLFRVSPPVGQPGIPNAADFPQRVNPFKGYFGIATAVSSQISLLETAGDAAVLADPQLAARSGKSASFLVGGEIPYQAINQDGSAQVTFKRFGVELEIEPVALSNGAIHSSVRAKVSEPDASLNPLSGVPGLRSREAQTWFNVHSGETMVIAGLLQRQHGRSLDRVPGVGRVPILGALFQGRRRDERATELVIFVTPRIVDAGDQPLAAQRNKLEKSAEQMIGAGERRP
jgi:pilus assembly protein CpaC